MTNERALTLEKMNEQHNKLLSECLDEVAKNQLAKLGATNPTTMDITLMKGTHLIQHEAALLALSRMQEAHEKEMKEQQAFYEWASLEWVYNPHLFLWENFSSESVLTTEELKAIWKEESNG